MSAIDTLMPAGLYEGYQKFRRTVYTPNEEHFQTLKHGQAPKVMVIGCADSRVDPATIFSTDPGEIFTIRNIAAIVPPYEAGGGQHGVSAAVEFAIDALGVEHIVVLGHGLCGGVAASLASAEKPLDGEFVPKWVALASCVRDRVLHAHQQATDAEKQRLAEYGTIEMSLENLLSFEFIKKRVAEKTLSLHGAWYSVYKGQLRWRDPDSGEFHLV